MTKRPTLFGKRARDRSRGDRTASIVARAAVAEERVPVIMDVDTGVDDCIALLYAVALPNVELVAATCCAGNVVAPRATANTLRFWNSQGQATSRSRSGVLPHSSRRFVRRSVTVPPGLGMPSFRKHAGRPLRALAPDLLIEEARRRPGAITLVATGPLTTSRSRSTAPRSLPACSDVS